ncbi:MAG: PDZ domain-containing protein [Candidatus Obscuribacter sp.]|nr:PDZ domain-containing protein [Candidatus Obscuribacter sp.]
MFTTVRDDWHQSKLYTNSALALALALILLLLCLPAIGKDSGYFGCDFVDNKVSATYYFAPAKMAGIKAGDQIVAINKQPVTAQNSQTTLTMLKGEPGTKVKVTVLRKGQS